MLLDENMEHRLCCVAVEALPTVSGSSVAPSVEEVCVGNIGIYTRKHVSHCLMMLHRNLISDLDAVRKRNHGLWCLVVEAFPTVSGSSVAPTAEVSVRRCLHGSNQRIMFRKAALVAARLPTTPAVLGSI